MTKFVCDDFNAIQEPRQPGERWEGVLRHPSTVYPDYRLFTIDVALLTVFGGVLSWI